MAGLTGMVDLQDPAYRGFATQQFKNQQKQGLPAQSPSVTDVLDDARELLREQKSKASKMGLNPTKVSAIRLAAGEDAIDQFELPEGDESSGDRPRDSSRPDESNPTGTMTPTPMIGKRARRASMFSIESEDTVIAKQALPGLLQGRKSAGAASPSAGGGGGQNKRFAFLSVSRGVSHCREDHLDENGDLIEDSEISFLPTNDQSRAGKQLDRLRILDNREPKTVRTMRTVPIITSAKSLSAHQISSDLEPASPGTDADSRSETGRSGGGKPLLPRLQLSQKSLDSSVLDSQGSQESGASYSRTPRSKGGLPLTSGLMSFTARRSTVTPFTAGDSQRAQGQESLRISTASGAPAVLPSLSNNTAPTTPRIHKSVGKQPSRLNMMQQQQHAKGAVPPPADGIANKLAPLSPRMLQSVEPLRTPRSLLGKIKDGLSHVFTSVRA